MNNLDYAHIPIPIDADLLLQRSYVTTLKNYAMEPQDTKKQYHDLMPLTDKSLCADDKCNGCAIYSEICPVQNIEMTDGKPVWQHHCQMCFACHEWCQAKAIHHWGRAEGIYYHHPEVELADMFQRR